jgi:hypothetical protein
MTQKRKGSATAPTVPSHGSTHPTKDKEMNVQTNITGPVLSASPNYDVGNWNRVRDLSKKLAEALASVDGGKWTAEVIPPRGDFPRSVRFMDVEYFQSSVRNRLMYHARCFKEAGMEIDPTVTEWGIYEAVADDLGERFRLSGLRKDWKSVEPDPLLDAINGYRNGIEELTAIADSGQITRENEDQIYQETLGKYEDVLDTWDQPAPTREGAIAALVLMGERDMFEDIIGEPLRKAVLGYLEASR